MISVGANVLTTGASVGISVGVRVGGGVSRHLSAVATEVQYNKCNLF